jgi:hypothetical protein
MFGAIEIYWSSEALLLLNYDGLLAIVAAKVCITFIFPSHAFLLQYEDSKELGAQQTYAS